MSPLIDLQRRIVLECQKIQHRLSGKALLSASHEFYTQQFQQLDSYRAQLIALVGKSQADAIIHDLYRKQR
jgi:hypothetical protein